MGRVVEFAGTQDPGATDAALEAMMVTLKNQMGVGYLEAIKDHLPPNEIVVAVEHQAT